MKIHINHLCSRLFFISLSILLFGSFLSLLVNPDQYNILPSKVILELLFMSLASLSIYKSTYRKFSYTSFNTLLGLFFYISLCFSIYFFNGVGNVYDFVIAYKFLMYFIFLLFVAVSSKSLNGGNIVFIFKIILVSMFFKYLASVFLFMEDRPGLFEENNYEVMLLIFSYLSYIIVTKDGSLKWFLVILSIIIMSGSKSGILLTLPLLYFVDYELRYKKALKLILMIVSLISVFYVLSSRLDGYDISEIDRYRFLIIFFDELSSWSSINYLFGTMPLTPLGQSSAGYLSFYHVLFSDYEKGLIFSVGLHSFILRAIYDHGFIGFFVSFLILNHILKISGVRKDIVSCVIVVLLINGLSVSSLNSVFAILGIVLILESSKVSES